MKLACVYRTMWTVNCIGRCRLSELNVWTIVTATFDKPLLFLAVIESEERGVLQGKEEWVND